MVNKKREREILYFAYGSNLKHKQMESRCPGFKYITNFYLKGYKLLKNKTILQSICSTLFQAQYTA